MDFVSEHNHPLQKPQACYLIPSQREVPEVACIDIHLADSSGIQPKEAHELLSRQVGGLRSLGYTITDHHNCLRDMRKKAMEYGAAVAIMKYFERRALENPSFQHFEEINEEHEIVNIVWVDAKMIADYVRFGDVVIFDTTFGTNKEKWAFGVFVGFNHFREIVVFGAALMFNQTIESFEWVFTNFLDAHHGKKPITIFTDQDTAMGVALEKVMPETRHGLCSWHINQNCVKHLMCYNRNGMNITGEFSACVYKYEEEDEFETAFQELTEKLNDNSWLKFIYNSKKKWAYCFMKDAVTLGIRSTQASESINSTLKNYLNSNLNINRFLEHFQRVLDGKHEKEIKSEYEMRRALPKIKFNVPILRQAGKLYTTKIFELFQAEFELSGSAQIECLFGKSYTVTMCDVNNAKRLYKSRQVVWNQDDQTVSCSCKKFEREGILCWHALKVLDREDIKNIPPKYILKRWTQDAKNDTVMDREGRMVIEDTMLDVRNRNGDMIREIAPTCAKAAYDEEQTEFMLNGLRSLREQYDEKYGNRSKRTNDCGEANPTSVISENSLRLKNKVGDKSKRSKRTKPWNENLPRTKKGKGRSISNSQALLRSSTNLSQGPLEENLGCYDNVEDIYDLTITQ